jgi:hypothetical protein
MKEMVNISLLFLVFFTSGLAQTIQKPEDRILFRGVVIAASTQERLVGSQILINRSISAMSRSDGTFSFYASKKDTIVFTMLGYKPATLIVRDTLRAKEFLTGVYLRSDTLDIGEVIILPRLQGLRAEIRNPSIEINPEMDNARNNLSIAAYQGRSGQDKMGDPSINYGYLREKQKMDAFERGGIPSDRIVGLNPLMLLPAAYFLLHGKPEAPSPPAPRLSSKDLEDLNRIYLEELKKKE